MELLDWIAHRMSCSLAIVALGLETRMEVEQSFQWQTPVPPCFEEHEERKHLSWKQSIS
jgi:hypothetical protein